MAHSGGTIFRKALRRLKPSQPAEMVKVENRKSESGREQQIPRVVYQTAESAWVHPSHAKSIAGFRDLNRDLSFELFDGAQRDSYMSAVWRDHGIFEVYRRATLGQMKADIFRYCIVWDRGGYYFDFNKGCGVPLTSLHPADASGLVSYESTPEMLFPSVAIAEKLSNPFNLVLQWGFGFVPRHDFLMQVINRIVEIEPFFRDKVFPEPKKALLTMSAPGVFTSVYREFVASSDDTKITEAGVDFLGHGIFRLRGSKKTAAHPYYGGLRDQAIIRSDPEYQPLPNSEGPGV